MTKLMSPGVYISQVPDVGYYYAPYIPTFMMKPKELLLQLHSQKLQYHTYSRETKEKADPDGEVIKTIQEIMQAHYPGSYIVEEYYDAKRMSFALRLKFEDPKQETFFKLKYPS